MSPPVIREVVNRPRVIMSLASAMCVVSSRITRTARCSMRYDRP